jgi:hypothetical protein
MSASHVFGTVRAFVSYSHEDRHLAAQTKNILAELGIDAFLAHEDLQVSDEWRSRILEELRNCDLFVPLFSERFVQSKWAPQEAGFIISRDAVAIAPLSVDGTPSYGFLGHFQSRRISQAGVSRELFIEPLGRRFPRVVLPSLIRIVAKAGTFRDAEAKLRPLVPLFSLLAGHEADVLAGAAVDNAQIWSAALCRDEYLPELLRVQGSAIEPKTRRALEYQLEHQGWYRAEDQ